MGVPPPFRPTDSDAVEPRLRRLEDHTARTAEWLRGHTDESNDVDRRVSKLERWQTEMLISIGASRARMSVVIAVVTALSTIVANVLKWFLGL